MNSDYRQRAPAEFEIPWLRLGLAPEQRRACIAAGLVLAAVAVGIAGHAYRKPDLAHLGGVVFSGGLAVTLLAAGWPPETCGLDGE